MDIALPPKLNPCPNCGGPVSILDVSINIIKCSRCHNGYTPPITKTHVAFAWNYPDVDPFELQARNNWIPVSERLPEMDYTVLVTGVLDDAPSVFNVFVAEYSEGEWKYDLSWNWKVIAWQPLPKAYEARNE